MQTLNSLGRCKCIRNNLLPPKPTKPLLSLFSSLIKTQNPHNSFMVKYLTETFDFSEQRAQSLSFRYNHLNSLEKPQSVVDYFQSLGFSQAHIGSLVRSTPQILFSDIDKILKPKIELFQQLGLMRSHLGKFLSNNSTVLTVSLENKLIPNIEILKKIVVNNGDLIKVIMRRSWILHVDPRRRLLSNIEYLKSCGIVGSQLSSLLKTQPRLFIIEEWKLRELVSRTLSLGFSVNSRMLVHGLRRASCMDEETFDRKLQLFRRLGFSKDEFIYMFRRSPEFISKSEEKLKLGLEFFLYKMVIKREVLLHFPVCLTYSLEGRVIPRYEVLKILISKRLLKKEPKFLGVLRLTEEKFLEKFVLKFRDEAEELLVAYKGHNLDCSSASSEEKEKDSEETES